MGSTGSAGRRKAGMVPDAVGRGIADPFDRPAWHSLGLEEVTVSGRRLPVRRRAVFDTPFCRLAEYRCRGQGAGGAFLVVPPLSGHFPFLLRDLVAALVEHRRVLVIEWVDARHVPPCEGVFAFDDNIGVIARAIEAAGPGVNVVALCQGVVPSLAAALVAERSSPQALGCLVLIAGPVDPLANPTRVVRLLRGHGPDWYSTAVIETVPSEFAGRGRRVYPAHTQLAGLMAYLARHLMQGGELARKLFADDGSAHARLPFLRLYTSLMDLPAELFAENIRRVFLDRDICRGTLSYRVSRLDIGSIVRPGLMTIEGEYDDIAAPGQTSAAHQICPRIADERRRRLVVRGSGHFSLFHGRVCRETVVPQIVEFVGQIDRSS